MKKKIIHERKAMNILIYDDKNIRYFNGKITSVEMLPDVCNFMGETLTNGYYINIYTNDLEELDNIILDETTMKRIEKYNKQIECKRLDKEIKSKQQTIKELDNLLQDKEKRWQKVKEYIKNIYEIDADDDYD